MVWLFLLLSTVSEAKTLYFRLNSIPVNFDWNGQVNLSDAPLVVNLNEGLFSNSYPSGKLQPAIASNVKKSKDLTEYTFYIRKDAKWSDGKPIYAQDFVNSWQRLLSPQSTSIYSYYLFDIVNAKEYNSKQTASFDSVGVKAIDDKTLIVKLKRPQTQWENNTTFWPLFPVRKDQIEKYGANWWRAGTLVSSGAFVLSSYEPGKQVVLKRNKFYTRASSNVDQVIAELVPNPEEAMKLYRSGHFRVISDIPSTLYGRSKDFHPIPLLRHHVIAFNTSRFPFNSKFFRLAVLSAVDQEKLLKSNHSNLNLAKSLIPPSLTGLDTDFSPDYNPKKAKEYFEQSGIVADKGFKLTILATFNEPFYGIAKNFAAQVEKVLKFPVEVMAYRNQEFETFSNLGEYNAVMLSWTAKVKTPQDFLYPYSGASVNKRTHYTNPELDEAIEKEDFKKAQQILTRQNGVMMPILFEKSGYLSKPNIKNIQYDYRGLPILKDVVLN